MTPVEPDNCPQLGKIGQKPMKTNTQSECNLVKHMQKEQGSRLSHRSAGQTENGAENERTDVQLLKGSAKMAAAELGKKSYCAPHRRQRALWS